MIENRSNCLAFFHSMFSVSNENNKFSHIWSIFGSNGMISNGYTMYLWINDLFLKVIDVLRFYE